MSGILVITQQQNGILSKVNFEIASKAVECAKSLGLSTTVLVMGNKEEFSKKFANIGIENLLSVNDEKIVNGYLNIHLKIIKKAITQIEPDYVFFPATTYGKSLSGMVAAEFKTSSLTDCITLQVKDKELEIQRPIYAGKAITTLIAKKKPVILSLRPNIFPIQENPASIKVQELSMELEEKDSLVQILEKVDSERQSVDISEATVIVAGGRGMKEPKYFEYLSELSKELGGAIASSRPVVDAGWRTHEEQIGQTGKTVSPKLYIACGISGAIQHLVGMRTADTIVAINKDPEAPIFDIADYGIVGDIFEVLPKMIKKAKELKN